MYKQIGLYYHTIRYLKPVQIFGRISFKLKKPTIAIFTDTPFPGLPLQWISPASKPQTLLGSKHFRLLNREYSLKSQSDWYNSRMDKLFLYHLHYFDDLNAERSAQRCQWHIELINDWIHDNAPAKHEGWEPYPLSLRIVNWIKWLLRGNEPPPRMIDSLMTQTHYLSQRVEFYLQGNHLIANAKALVFAGLFFLDAGKKWYQQGISVLKKELPKQILSDGGHIERSTQYHCLVLEDILDCINIQQAFGHEIPLNWQKNVYQMLNWLYVMRHPDGEIALFNDAAFNMAVQPDELFTYAQRLGFNIDKHHGSVLLPQTGYARLSKGRIQVFIDTAPLGPDYLPGHAHADTFTFECSLDQQRIIVNSGTSTYEKNSERLRQRGTLAHNTLVIDKKNSSEVWGSFRVAKRARVQNMIYQFNNSCEITATHDGYRRLRGKIFHKRTWRLCENNLLIMDEVSGSGHHHLILSFHIHPALGIERITINHFSITQAGKVIAQLELDEQLTGMITDSTYHPEFGLSIANKKIQGEANLDFPLLLTTKILWPVLKMGSIQ